MPSASLLPIPLLPLHFLFFLHTGRLNIKIKIFAKITVDCHDALLSLVENTRRVGIKFSLHIKNLVQNFHHLELSLVIILLAFISLASTLDQTLSHFFS